jgi:hypothetical protein
MKKDKRIGKRIQAPYPKCPCCNIHMDKRQNILQNTWFWWCFECQAEYEINEVKQ